MHQPPSRVERTDTQGSGLHHFGFQPDLLVVGTTYEYIKSNLDGSKPARVIVRLVSETRLEVLKIEAGLIDMAYVVAEMDWERFSARRLASAVITADGQQHPRATLTLDPGGSAYEGAIGGGTETVAVGYLPVHVYNFDLISFNLTLRFLRDPERPFAFGILDPNFDPNIPHRLLYKGEALVHYVADEPCLGVACRRYTISGAPFGDQRGQLWVDRDAGHLVNVEIPVPDNPDWESFKFTLQRITHLDQPAWETLIATEAAALPED